MVNIKKEHRPWIYVSAVLVGALSFAVALAWNEFIKTILKEYFNTGDGAWGIFLYTALVTIVLIVSAYILARFLPDVFEAM
jgi:hypothetical protein